MKLAPAWLKLARPDSEGNYAARFLSGNARVWLITSLDAVDSYPDWEALKDALCHTCGPRHDREKARIRMISVKPGRVYSRIVSAHPSGDRDRLPA